jgi:formate hydrogenlyase subunit 4
LILFACLLGLARFFTILAAWDTGSSFEGMGASREAQFAALAESPLLLALAALATQLSSLSLGEIYAKISLVDWMQSGPALALTASALFIVLVAENSRIPVDDPNTHLELTMIHEVMVLDHGGPDLAFILYGSALKLWCFAALLAGLVFPGHSAFWWLDVIAGTAAIFGIAVLVGVVESIMARLRLLVVPQLLVGAGALAAVALILILR